MIFMSTDFSQVEQSALSLPQSDRARLAGSLLRSLETEVDDPQVVAEQWEEVILARSEALHQGRIQFVSGEQVIEELRTMISNSQPTAGQ